MPIDANILLQHRGTQSDPGAAMERGMRMGDMLKQRRDEQAIKDAYKAGVVQNPDGTSTVDRKKTIASLMQTNPQEAFKAEQAFRAQDLESMKQKHAEIDMIGQLAGSATDQASYDRALIKAKEIGLNVDGIPPQFDPKVVQGIAMSSMNAKERLELEMRKAEVEESRRMRWSLAGQQKNEREEQRTNQGVEKLQGKIQPLQDIQNSINTVEGQMGFKIDSYDPATETAVVNGKKQKIDLPGVSVPGLGRVKAYSTEARTLANTMDRVFNVELKDRSGAAVTTPELDRLRAEFSAGKFNTESEMISALKRYKAAATAAMKNVEAGYAPKVVDTYQGRGGMTSRSVGGGKTLVKTQTNQKTGERRAIYDDGTSEIIGTANTAGR